MFKPVEMTRVRVVGLRRDAEAVIERLHEAGIAQIDDISEDGRYAAFAAADRPMDKFGEISKHLVALRSLESTLMPQKTVHVKALPLKTALEKAALLESTAGAEMAALKAESDSLTKREAELQALRDQLQLFKSLDADLSLLQNPKLAFFSGEMPAASIESALAGMSAERLLHAEPSGKRVALVLAVPAEHAEKTAGALAKRGFAGRELPRLAGRPKKILDDAAAEMSSIAARRTAIGARIAAVSRAHYAETAALREMLEIEAQRAEVTANFGRTENAFIFEAWVPAADYARLERSLGEISAAVHAERLAFKHGEAPTKLRNPKPAQPFEFLVRFISVPRSDEFDPTAFFALTFPIIYGMMLGDVGYGALALLLALVLHRKAAGMAKTIAAILVPASVSSIIFGFLFGEFFGFEFYHAPINRLEDVQTMLLITIAIGALHLGFGLFLGFLEALGEKNYKHAFAKLGWIGIEAGALVLLSQQLAGAAILLISLALILRGEGIFGLIEIPGLLSNVLSYTRIVAVGIASVAFALVVNAAKPEPSMGIAAIFMAVVFLLGHLLNFVLGLFEPFVQAARLHYVEFFTKFYRGGGALFTPFKANRTIVKK